MKRIVDRFEFPEPTSSVWAAVWGAIKMGGVARVPHWKSIVTGSLTVSYSVSVAVNPNSKGNEFIDPVGHAIADSIVSCQI